MLSESSQFAALLASFRNTGPAQRRAREQLARQIGADEPKDEQNKRAGCDERCDHPDNPFTPTETCGSNRYQRQRKRDSDTDDDLARTGACAWGVRQLPGCPDPGDRRDRQTPTASRTRIPIGCRWTGRSLISLMLRRIAVLLRSHSGTLAQASVCCSARSSARSGGSRRGSIVVVRPARFLRAASRQSRCWRGPRCVRSGKRAKTPPEAGPSQPRLTRCRRNGGKSHRVLLVHAEVLVGAHGSSRAFDDAFDRGYRS